MVTATQVVNTLDLQMERLSDFIDWAANYEDCEVSAEVMEKLEDASSCEEFAAIAKYELLDQEALAHLILGCCADDVSEQVSHYQTVVNLTGEGAKQYSDRMTIRIFALASVGLGRSLWTLNKRTEAIGVLESVDVNELLSSQTVIDAVRFMLVSYLICENQDDRARLFLDGEAVETVEWCYLNALLKFRASGNSYVSRGALGVAFSLDTSDISDLLIGTEYNAEDFELENLDYANCTNEAWKSTPGAIEWFQSILDEEEPRLNCGEIIDAVREKRIFNEVGLSQEHLRRQDWKSAKRCLGQALREADRLNDGGRSFFDVLKICASLSSYFESDTWIVERLNNRLDWVTRQAASAESHKLVYSYYDLSKGYATFGNIEQAELCARKSLELIPSSRERLDAFIELNVLTLLGTFAKSCHRYNELEIHLRTLVPLRESVLGSSHLGMIDDLQMFRYVLHQVGKHEEEREIANRVHLIDQYADTDLDEEDCDWCEV